MRKRMMIAASVAVMVGLLDSRAALPAERRTSSGRQKAPARKASSACGSRQPTHFARWDEAATAAGGTDGIRAPLEGETCLAIGARREATATLTAPLDDRAVLEVQQGTPVPVRRT